MTHEPNHPTPNDLPAAVERLAAAAVNVAHRRGDASGVVWRPGLVVTSASALWRASRWRLLLADGSEAAATLRGADPGTDLAVFAFEGAGPAPVGAVAGDAPAARVGDFIFAAGRDGAGRVQASFGHVGLVDGPWRSGRGGRIDRLIRLDGGLYPGLAGAPVGRADGRCIGIASPAFHHHHALVLPAATIDRVLDALLAHGRVAQGYLGIAAQPVRASLAGAPTSGLLVSSVADDGPAAAAGLLVGDVIVQAGGEPAASLEALRERLDGAGVGGALAVTVARGGQPVELQLPVIERPQPPGRGCR